MCERMPQIKDDASQKQDCLLALLNIWTETPWVTCTADGFCKVICWSNPLKIKQKWNVKCGLREVSHSRLLNVRGGEFPCSAHKRTGWRSRTSIHVQIGVSEHAHLWLLSLWETGSAHMCVFSALLSHMSVEAWGLKAEAIRMNRFVKQFCGQACFFLSKPLFLLILC